MALHTFVKGDATVMPQENHFWFPKEPFSEQFLKKTFLSVKNILEI